MDVKIESMIFGWDTDGSNPLELAAFAVRSHRIEFIIAEWLFSRESNVISLKLISLHPV